MSLRYCRFYLSGYLRYYGHIRLPSVQVVFPAQLGSPTFMHYLLHARNIILPRIAPTLQITVLFKQDGRFHHLWKTDRYHLINEAWLIQLIWTLITSLDNVVSFITFMMASAWTANWAVQLFHLHRYLSLEKHARFVAHHRIIET